MLLLNEMMEIKVFVELICLSSGITEETLLIELLGGLHGSGQRICIHASGLRQTYIQDFLRRHMQQTGSRLLQINGGEGKGFPKRREVSESSTTERHKGIPFGRRFCCNRANRRLWFFDALLIQDKRRRHVEQVVATPVELDRAFGTLLFDIDVPKCLGHKRLDSFVLIDDESQCRELTWSWG